MQILGLYGQLDEKSEWAQLGGRMRHMYLRSRDWSLAGGASEMSRNIIAGKYGLGLPSLKPLVMPMVLRLTEKEEAFVLAFLPTRKPLV
jgi:hypothetical protein